MGQAVAQKFPHAEAKYRFINRGRTKFSKQEANELIAEIERMRGLQLTNEEYWWLKKTCLYLTPVYIDLLGGYRYNPDEIKVDYNDGDLEIEIAGPWYRTIYWEVPLMALISEIYNRDSKQPSRTDIEVAEEKARKLSEYAAQKIFDGNFNGFGFADFGTRRRFSLQHHNDIVEALALNGEHCFVGTSNVHLAMEHNLRPIGTQAHEWFMFHGAKYGYREANRLSLKNWVDVYHGNLGIALTDTFGTNDFFRAFGSKYSKLFDGVRHDSGDPIEFGEKVVNHYIRHGIDPKTKTIVFSDGLDPIKAIEIDMCFANHIKCSYGIGTNLTNDIHNGIKPLNMVIKMTECKPYGESDWLPVVKLSDNEGKHTGSPEEIKLCQRTIRDY